MFFKNRREAGTKLAEIVLSSGVFSSQWDVVGIARGGVIIADEIAKVLNTRPKAICIEKLHIAGNTLLTISSLGSGVIFTDGPDGQMGMFIPDLSRFKTPKTQELIKNVNDKHLRLAGSPTTYGERVLLCDDGVVSGRTLLTAVQALRYSGVSDIAVAIPVVLPWVTSRKDFPVFTWRMTKMTRPATGMFYNSFDDTEDAEVIKILQGRPEGHLAAA